MCPIAGKQEHVEIKTVVGYNTKKCKSLKSTNIILDQQNWSESTKIARTIESPYAGFKL